MSLSETNSTPAQSVPEELESSGTRLPRLSFRRPSFHLPRVHLGGIPRPGITARLNPSVVLPDSFSHPLGSLGNFVRRSSLVLVALLAAIALVAGSAFSGVLQGSDDTLVYMGFDPDRAQLISGLIIGGVAAALATLVAGRLLVGLILGTGACGAIYGQTYINQTQNALAATGTMGSFSGSGWVLTLITVLVIGCLAAWAGAAIASTLRPVLIDLGGTIAETVRTRRITRPAAGKLGSAVLICALLAVTVPAFDDMINFAPDFMMLNGGHVAPLAPNDTIPSQLAVVTPKASPSSAPSASEAGAPTPRPTATSTPHASPGTKPWLAWKPTGTGHVDVIQMKAPWTGVSATTVEVSIYTPPGYSSDFGRFYPVLYEAPSGLHSWDTGAGMVNALDQMIAQGTIPASIVVFTNLAGSPYADSQCADAWDRKMWAESFLTFGVVDYVDANYKTIASPQARGVMGMSSGGFCSAMLLARHPDVFGTSISFSGYFWAGMGSASAPLPYNWNQDLENAVSPAVLAPGLSESNKKLVYFIVDARPIQPFFGEQAAAFEGVLKANGIGYKQIDSTVEHGWGQVRLDFPTAVQEWAARMVIDGVW